MKQIKIFLGLAVLTLVACSTKPTQHDDVQVYKLLHIESNDIQLSSNYSASIRGQQDIKIVPRVDGYLTEICIKEGERVREGQILFIIDQVAYQATLQAAKANVAVSESSVANAQLTYNSKKNLFDKNIISSFDLNTAENELKTAEATLLQAKAQEAVAQNNLSFTVIKSPSNGVVGKIPYRKGDYVTSTTQEGLTVVADNAQMYVYFSMTEFQIMELIEQYKDLETAIAQLPAVQLKLVNQTRYKHSGKIESISGIVDATTGAVSVRAVFPNKEGILLSGGAGSIELPYQYTDAIVIPQEATFEIQDKTYVYKVIDGTTVASIIEVEKINNGKEYIVTKGLAISDIIIAEGAGLVQEGTKVKMN